MTPGATKYAVDDPEFYTKMRAHSLDLMEEGTVIILEHTGMHRWSLRRLEPGSLRRVGTSWFLYWKAPKRQRKVRYLRARIPPGDAQKIQDWLVRCGGRSEDWYYRVVRTIGERAGFPDVSPNTYRHQRIVNMIAKGTPINRVAHLVGATYDTIEKHYAQFDPNYFEGDDQGGDGP